MGVEIQCFLLEQMFGSDGATSSPHRWSIRPSPPEEDDTIIRAQAQFGNKWTTISRLLSGKTDKAIKYYWNSTLKRKCASMGSIDDPHFAQPLKRSVSVCAVVPVSMRSMAVLEKAWRILGLES
ncbi:transcription factor MYB44-like [Arachis stenosperma]|uniref:transcription factor MYB44-like n=1 Tax=Arachis stenosperma TaxID=217475 RepID=UPI0025AD75A4|nr:transcription factor MYB44-like [Arachis stenosperma]